MSVSATYKEYHEVLNHWEAIQNRLPPNIVTPFSLKVASEINNIKAKLQLLDEKDSGFCEDV